MRHCVRSTTLKVKRASPAFTDVQSYSNEPLPAWGVPEKMCTAGGLEIIRGTAADLLKRYGVHAPLTIITDTSVRDVDTALALQEVFGPKAGEVLYDAHAFDSLKPDDGSKPLCAPMFSDKDVAATVRKRLSEVSMPADLQSTLSRMQTFIGVGDAGLQTSLMEFSTRFLRIPLIVMLTLCLEGMSAVSP
eukprot:6193718-Pleurochrysis_carterae.AAC.2